MCTPHTHLHMYTRVCTHLYMQTHEHGNFSSSALCTCAAPLPLFLCSLLFISNGTTVTFQKVNNRPPQDSNVCSCKLDRILAMKADPDSQRIFWVSLRYSRLILNWASYTRETCNNRCVHTHMYCMMPSHMHFSVYACIHTYMCTYQLHTYVSTCI